MEMIQIPVSTLKMFAQTNREAQEAYLSDDWQTMANYAEGKAVICELLLEIYGNQTV